MVRDDLSVFDDKRFSKLFTQIVIDLMAAGFDASAATASWGMLYLIKKPKVVQKCRDELSKLSDRQESDCLFDVEVVKKSCPYFMATLYEILRISTVAPLAILHKTTCDTSIQGYPVSKGTIVIPNLYQINHDPDEWSEPEEFFPERFLVDMKSLNRDDQQNESKATKIYFGRPEKESLVLNQKMCNGIASFSSSLSMLCLLFGTLIRRYDFELVKPPEDMVPIRGFTSKPKHCLVKLNKI